MPAHPSPEGIECFAASLSDCWLTRIPDPRSRECFPSFGTDFGFPLSPSPFIQFHIAKYPANAMMSVATSVFPLAVGVPATQVAPSVEEKGVLQPSLTLLVFILIPCVVLLFFLNCFLLFHRLPSLSPKQRSKRRGGPRCNNPYVRATHFRLPPGCLGASNKSLCDGRCASISQGLEPTLALGESAHVSMGTQSREWCHKLEETQGHYSPRPSRIAIVPFSSSRSCGMPHEGDRSWNEVEDDRGGTRSSSEQETRYNAAPPNTPAAPMAPGTVTPNVKFGRKTSTHRKRLNGVTSFTPLGSVLFDNASSIPPEDTPSYLYHNSSSTGPGLDSDFGVSAGVSLHILSSDSDSGSHSWASGMEWDYYDPCYMRKNRLRNENRQLHNLPVICGKQYWV